VLRTDSGVLRWEGAVGKAEVVGDRVDDEEGEVGDGGAGGVELLERGGGTGVVEGVRLWGKEGGEVGKGVDEVEVGGEGFEARAEGVGGVVVGGEEEGGHWFNGGIGEIG
jgi:hypothetical protein